MKSNALYPYQTRVSEFAKDKPRAGIFVGFGGGKTYLSLKWLEDIYKWRCQYHPAMASPLPALVLTLKTVIPQWGQQIAQHSDFSYSLVQGTAAQRVNAFKTKADIYVASYDLLRSPAMLKLFEIVHTTETTYAGKIKHHFKGTGITGLHTVIVDESTLLKEARTQRFKALRILCSLMPYRVLLTGKPILEKAEEIWAQMMFLDGGETFGRSFWKFRYNYFTAGPPWSPYDWDLKPGAEQQIANKLNCLCIRIAKKEVAAELPPKRYIKVHFKMPKSTRIQYKQLKKDFCATLLEEDSEYTTKWAIGRSQKMHQLCQGIFYKEDGGYDLFNTMKLDWLQENIPFMLKEGPILIWTDLIRMVPLITAVLTPIPLRTYVGEGMNDTQREDAKKAFQNGKVDILVLSERMGYAGLDLWRANQAVFLSTDYPAGMRNNAEDRCHRIGSEIHKAVTYYDLIVEDSMDEVILDTIKNRLNMSEEILKHVRKE